MSAACRNPVACLSETANKGGGPPAISLGGCFATHQALRRERILLGGPGTLNFRYGQMICRPAVLSEKTRENGRGEIKDETVMLQRRQVL